MTEHDLNRWLRFGLGILVLSLIPLLAVAVYSRPFADDFAYAVYTHAAWRDTHSLPAVIGAVARQLAETMTTWQGSFSAIVLFSLEPGLFGDRFYGFSTVILIACFLLGHFVFFYALLFREKKTAAIVSSFVCLLLMQTLPHAFQGFYWWNGSSYYTLFYSLFLIQLALLLKLTRSAGPGWIRLTIPACLFGFLLGGGNLVTALLNTEITVLWAILLLIRLRSRREQRSLSVSLLPPVAITLFTAAGFLLNVLAPGNSVRMDTESPIPAFRAIVKSFDAALAHVGYWTTGATLTLLFLLAPFLWHAAGLRSRTPQAQDRIRFPFALTAAIGFCLFASCFTPTFYAMNEVGPRRIQNIRYDFFLLLLVILEYQALCRIRDHFALSAVRDHAGAASFLRGYFLLAGVAVLVLTAVYVLPRENRDTLTSVAAARSLLVGEAQRYAAERDAWIDPLESGDDPVELTPLTDHPQPIYYVDFDITADPDDYRNLSMEMYYGKETIVLK